MVDQDRETGTMNRSERMRLQRYMKTRNGTNSVVVISGEGGMSGNVTRKMRKGCYWKHFLARTRNDVKGDDHAMMANLTRVQKTEAGG